MMKTKLSKRIMSVFLCLALILSYVPISAMAVSVASTAVAGTVVDPGSAHTWESMMGTDVDGNRYAGRVWVDKSVFKNGDTAVLNNKGEDDSSFKVELEDDESFQIVFSALGSTMSSKTTISSSSPLDVVLILDDSTSMDDIISKNTTRLEKLINASNSLIADLLTTPDIRIGIVAYNNDAIKVLPFDRYENGVVLKVLNNKFVFDENNGTDKGGTIQAHDKSGKLLYNNTDGYDRGTNVQAGFDMGMSMLKSTTDTKGRTPVAILLTDGAANTAVQNRFYNISGQSPVQVFKTDDQTNHKIAPGVTLATLLNAAFNKASVEDHYGVSPMVYGVGVDLGGNAAANAIINPGAKENGFNSSNTSSDIRTAYNHYINTWINGGTVSLNDINEYSNQSFRFTIDHGYKNGTNITTIDITDNINYVDTYYDVSSADLEITFKQIYEELSSGVFNPISTSTSTEGATGVDDTPLIYVDFIGRHMEVKDIQSVTLFGSSYAVIKNADGTYKVDTATGTNPTTNEAWNTSEDILISIVEQNDGTQKLEIRINQEILPIIVERVVSETIGGDTTSTITEFLYNPLRVYYTVGIDSDILLPNGEVDVSKIRGYDYIDDNEGIVSFYSNRFGVMNPADNGIVYEGDAHVGFQPSEENRYYYHQSNQGIFTEITNKEDGSAVSIPENNEYGIVWDDAKYDLSWMSYDDYKKTADSDKVYTYVTYTRPTHDANDSANAAEEVTYLVYTEWGYLKESAAFYDNKAEKYVNADENGGYTLSDKGVAIPEDRAEKVLGAYLADNSDAELYVLLGVGSLRTSRLHNMTVEKEYNVTETASQRYTPEYTHETAEIHNGNSVVVWLGNNGRVNVSIDTGIKLTKSVTDNIGNEDDTYSLTVTVPAGVVADPVVWDENGNDVTKNISSYENNVLKVELKAGETVYVAGIPGGTACEIGEIIKGDYYKVDSLSDSTVTVPTLSQVLDESSPVAQFATATVTNAPNEYGNLFITKEIASDHAIPQSVLDTAFEIVANVGRDLSGKSFTVKQTEKEDKTVTVDADGNMTFSIKARETVEIMDIPAGTDVTVTESDHGAHFRASFRTRNHSGETADSDNSVVIPKDASATAIIINQYTPFATTVDLDIDGAKIFEAEGSHNGGEFTFAVQKWNGSDWESISEKTAKVGYAAGEDGTKSFKIEDVLSGITYSEVGSHSYQVIEVKGNVANVTYDRTVYAFDVKVTDNGGQLIAEVTDASKNVIVDGTFDVTFKNTYHTAPVSVDIIKEVINNSGDDTVSKAGFEFHVYATDEEWNILNPVNEPDFKLITDAAGTARFSSVYTQGGTFHYVISEVNKGDRGWSYSDAEYRITVSVTESNGDLIAALDIEKVKSNNDKETATVDPADATKGRVSFVNSYTPDSARIDLDGAVMKVLTGKPLEADEFTFYVYNNGDRENYVLKGTNNLNGNVLFVDFDEVLTFDKVGKYEFDIVEYIPEGAVYNAVTNKYVLNGMSYDPTVYDLVVEVENDPVTGTLTAVRYFEDAISNVVTYHNHYEAKATEYTIGGTKILHGRAPRAGEFSFTLYEGNEEIETVTNKADGTFSFSTITYKTAGERTYTVKENDGTAAGVIYNGVDHPVTVTVTVIDTNGVLTASADTANADIKFENTYKADAAELVFGGTKTLKGTTLNDGDFTFNLYATDYTFDITSNNAVLLDSKKNADGKFEFDARVFNSTGTYFFVIAEDSEADPIEGIVYDGTLHKYAAYVSDNGDGQLKIMLINAATGETVNGETKINESVSFTNASIDEVTKKEVYKDDISTVIDGEKVNTGDILTYNITYTNYTGADVIADILDAIPEHTTYVKGSASHNGKYAGDHINWILNVKADESVTVSFKVEIAETDAIIDNAAIVRDGVNTYITNEVVNHTVENLVEKDVFYPENDSVSINGEKVYAGEELLYKISFTNASDEPADITITDKIPEFTTYVEGSADMGGVFENGYIVWSIENVEAWTTAIVTFAVKVDSALGAEKIENTARVNDGTNEYTTNAVTNYTVVDEVVKDVFLASDDSVSIDDKKVYTGDELVYTISYENTSEETVTVTITDTVPAHTTYVEGSASQDGVYENGTITWTLDVEKNDAVTVSFHVTVDKVESVEISNRAEIREGRNTYTTNQVTNYTVTEEFEKDVSLAGNDEVSLDGRRVYAGDELVYSIYYRNVGRDAVRVTITDIIPEHTTLVEGTVSHNGVYENGNIVWTLDLDSGESVTVSFHVTVDEAEDVEISNEAEIREGRNSYTTNKVVIYTAEDEVRKDVFFADNTEVSIDGNKVYDGDELIYEISYTNNSRETADVTITDILPEFTTYVEGSADNNGVYSNRVVTWNLRVDAGETVKVRFNVTIDSVAAVTINNAADVKVGRNTYTTNEVTNYTVVDEVEKNVAFADNGAVSIDGRKVYAGDEIVYSIFYKNVSREAAIVTIIDTIPQHTLLVEGTITHSGVYEDGKITWILDVEAGDSVTVSFNVKVEDAGNATVENEAEIRAGRNTYTTNKVTNYTVDDEVKKDVFYPENTEFSVDGKKVYAGDILQYSISYTNSAPHGASVVINDSIPEYTTYVDGSADNGGTYNGGMLTWLLDVEAGETVIVNFKVEVKNVGSVTIENVAEIREGRNTYRTNEVSNYTVEDEVEKNVFLKNAPLTSIDGESVNAGDVLKYEISYKNTSHESATVVIDDTVPEYTTYVEGSADNGGIYNDGAITWALEVGAGENVTVGFEVKVDAEAEATVRNKATIAEGKNTYTTNEVENTVFVPEEPSDDPESPETPGTSDTPNAPQTGDSGLWMWFALLFVSGIGVMTTTLRRKKRRGSAQN